MSLSGKYALVTGGSRGIGRGIALKLAAAGAKVAIHYYQNEAAARATLSQVRERGSDGFVLQGDVCRMSDVRRLFQQVKESFGALDILVHNARTEPPTFYSPPLEITLEQWDTAMDSQAKAFLVGVRESLLLCAEESAWITGQLINVDGGASLMDARLPLEIQQVARNAEAA